MKLGWNHPSLARLPVSAVRAGGLFPVALGPLCSVPAWQVPLYEYYEYMGTYLAWRKVRINLKSDAGNPAMHVETAKASGLWAAKFPPRRLASLR